jgi:hypothetical protein
MVLFFSWCLGGSVHLIPYTHITSRPLTTDEQAAFPHQQERACGLVGEFTAARPLLRPSTFFSVSFCLSAIAASWARTGFSFCLTRADTVVAGRRVTAVFSGILLAWYGYRGSEAGKGVIPFYFFIFFSRGKGLLAKEGQPPPGNFQGLGATSRAASGSGGRPAISLHI